MFNQNKKVLQKLSEIYCRSREIRAIPEGSENISSKNYFIHRRRLNKNKSDWHYQRDVRKHVLHETATESHKGKINVLKLQRNENEKSEQFIWRSESGYSV